MANISADQWMSTLGIDIVQRRAKSSAAAGSLSDSEQELVGAALKGDGQSLELDADGQSLAPVAPDPATLALKQKIRTARSEAKGAVGRYDAQKDAESGHGIVSGVSDFMTSVASRVSGTGAFQDPGDAVWDGTSAAQDAADSADSALASGDTETAAAYADQAGDAAGNASRLADGYGGGMVSGAGDAVTGLQAVKTGAEVTEIVLGTVVTAGAASAALAGGTATTAGVTITATTAVPLVGEVSTATVATGISLTQGIGETVGAAAVKAAQGDTIDLAAVGADVLVQIVLARFGGSLSTSLSGVITKQLAGRVSSEVLSKYLPRIIAREILQEGSAVLRTVVQAAGETFSGQKVTPDQFFQALSANMLDVKGIVIAAITGSLEAQYMPAASAPSAGAELPDATADAIPIATWTEGTAPAAAPNPAAAAPAPSVAAQAPSAAPPAAAGSALPPPKIVPPSATDAANAALSQMTDEEIQQSVDNWKTGESTGKN